MKTIPNIDHKPNVIHTVIPNLSVEIVKAPSFVVACKDLSKESTKEEQLSGIECTPDFSFEKERIKALEHTQLFVSLNSTNVNQDAVLCPSKVEEILYNNAITLKVWSTSKHLAERISNTMRILCTVISLFSTVGILAVILAILFSTISSFSRSTYMHWLISEICCTIIYMIFSLKGSSADQFSLQTLNRYFKYLIIYGILMFSLLVILMLQKSLGEILECAINTNESDDSRVSIRRCSRKNLS